jgi:selenocysteine-specific elongation factor
MPYIIGTAGHVDHGKSTLVTALTGIDPDRLAEEKAREMTIDLGFAWLTLPDGESVGIIDVPGHRDFIENMLAGVGGIDLALFVVAADEGVMPQTREHLIILDLLGIPGGVVALTKTDMISDPEWIDLVTLDLIEAFQGTVLEHAPIVPISARMGDGLDTLVAALSDALQHAQPRADRGKPRLPVDRVFSISGFGTVATGTLIDGALRVGDEVEILPSGRRARIRGLQTHKQAASEVNPGSRVAINLSGVTTDEIQRGDVIAAPGLLQPTTLIDVSFQHIGDAPRPLKHNSEVKFFSGAAEATAHVRLLGDRALAPGASGWLQLRLETSLAVEKGDRFILRYPSPAETIGGGAVLDAHPAHRWRRFKPEIITRLETLAAGRPEDLLLQMLEGQTALTRVQTQAASKLGAAAFEEALRLLEVRDDIIYTGGDLVMARAAWNRLVKRVEEELHTYHTSYPLRIGMPREALRSRLSLEGKMFNPLISYAAQQGIVVDEGASIHLPDHSVSFTVKEQAAVDRLWEAVRQNPANPPNVKDAGAMVGEDVLQALIERGDFVLVSEDVLLDSATCASWMQQVEEFIQQEGAITVAQARDLFGSSRKYVLAFLEHLDSTGVTKRSGDERVLRTTPSVH